MRYRSLPTISLTMVASVPGGKTVIPGEVSEATSKWPASFVRSGESPDLANKGQVIFSPEIVTSCGVRGISASVGFGC